MTNANLIPKYRQIARSRRRLTHRWIGVVGIYFLVTLIAIPVTRLRIPSEETRIRQIAKNNEDIEASKNRLHDLVNGLNEIKLSLRATRLVENQSDWSILLGVLAEEMGDAIVLRECVMNPDGISRNEAGPERFQIDLRGYGQSQMEVSQYVLRLEGTGLFSEVTLEESRREGFLENDAIAFRLRCRLANRQEKST